MKLIRYGKPGEEKPGLLLPDGRRIDVSAVTPDFDPDFFASAGLSALQAWVDGGARGGREISLDARLGPPVARVGKLICVGLNFRDHAAESGMAAPAEPVLFFKATSAICGPDDPLLIPRGSEKTDWEVELAVVIGRRATYVDEPDALSHVAGYVLHNDYSERAFQLERGGQWVKGKSHDSFAPLGPFLATIDEVANPGSLGMWLDVNGEPKQRGTTADLIFGIPTLVSYISRFMTLHPGDVISTGTPAGVGLGLKPPQYLKPGDVIELGIDGLGSSRQVAVAYPD